MFSEKLIGFFVASLMVVISLFCSTGSVNYCHYVAKFMPTAFGSVSTEGKAAQDNYGIHFSKRYVHCSSFILNEKNSFRRENEHLFQLWVSYRLLDREWPRAEIYFMRINHLRSQLKDLLAMLEYSAVNFPEIVEYNNSMSVFCNNCLVLLDAENPDRKRLKSLLLSVEYLMQQRFVQYALSRYPVPYLYQNHPAKFYSAFIYLNYFRWTPMAQQRLNSSFLFPECADTELFRHLMKSSCFEEDRDEHSIETTGRLTIPGQSCENGLYYEININKEGMINHILFEID